MRLPVSFALLSAALLAPPCLAEDLGRLFFSPQERQQLDSQGVPRQPEPAAANAPPDQPASIRLDGIVRRSDGSATVWVNGRAAPGSAARRFADNTGAALRLPDGRRIDLKVGDTRQLADPAGDPPEGSQ